MRIVPIRTYQADSLCLHYSKEMTLLEIASADISHAIVRNICERLRQETASHPPTFPFRQLTPVILGLLQVR